MDAVRMRGDDRASDSSGEERGRGEPSKLSSPVLSSKGAFFKAKQPVKEPKGCRDALATAILSRTPSTMKNFCVPALAGFVIGAMLMMLYSSFQPSDASVGRNLVTHLFSRTGRRSYLFHSHQQARPLTPPELFEDRELAVEAGGGGDSPAKEEGARQVEEEKEPESDPYRGPLYAKRGLMNVPFPKPPPTPDWLEGTAIVTLATGDTSARDALVLMRTLREVGTAVPNLVVLLSRGGLGSADCNNAEWRKTNNRQHISCGGMDTIAPEIASQQYLDEFARMGVQYVVVDPIPDTNYTIIPGGRQFFWGMAFNKLLVFNMVQYKKLMWMDSDAFVVRNIDHLMKEPMLTGAFVAACCHPGGPAYPGGGIWVVEPSVALYQEIMDLIAKPVPGTENDPWHWGDMQVIRHYFGIPPAKDTVEPYWPAINDGRHGYVPGLRYMPKYKNMTEVEFNDMIDKWLDKGKPRKEGFIPELWDGKRPAWRALDIRYDQCVGHCQCSPERDAPEIVYSVHFSCLHDVGKPGGYSSEEHLLGSVYNYAEGCTRFWFKTWYATYMRAHGRFPEPYYTGPPVPSHNATHDEFVFANRIAFAQRDK